MINQRHQPSVTDLEVVKDCPICGSQKLNPRFDVRLITNDLFHSVEAKLDLSVATVVACHECTFVFKDTRPSAVLLNRLYTQSNEGYLKSIAEDNVEHREDFQVARQMLHEAFPRGGSILDVGCASGFFLESLGQNWHRQGVELFRLAVERSRRRPGVVVHESDLTSAAFPKESFDVVCFFDVIEHLTNPIPMFQEARRILKPGGWLLLGTGNSGSFAARMAGSRWTYLCIPEHISFFNPRSLKKALGQAHFSTFKFKLVHHGLRSRSVTTGWLRAVGKQWAVTLFGQDIVRMRIFRQKTTDFFVPFFFDHMICVAR